MLKWKLLLLVSVMFEFISVTDLMLFLAIIRKTAMNKTFLKFLSKALWHLFSKMLLKWCFPYIIGDQCMFLGPVTSHRQHESK